jgi:peptidoglycan hydrolase-like protein with peptidoglycan-binding domain
MSSMAPEARDRAARPARRRRLAAVALPLCAGVVGLAAWQLWPGPTLPIRGGDVAVLTARAVRTDVAERQVVPGTLGYRGSLAVVNQAQAGIITWALAPGTVAQRGEAIYKVDNQAVTLLYGAVPAWRPFEPGMPPGPDVRELQRNLRALGFDPGHQMTLDDRFTWATAAAIDRWQHALGQAQTGIVPLGGAVFLPAALRVTSVSAKTGQPVTIGAPVLGGTSTIPSVSMNLPVGQAAVRRGDRVAVTLPGGTTHVSGVVSGVGRVAVTPAPAAGGTGQGPATIPVTIRFLRAGNPVPGLDQAPVQVALTERVHRGVLAVPVTALLAHPGGGYAVQLASGSRPLIHVTTGLFDDATGLVEVSGAGLAAGVQVEVAAG